MNSFQLYTHTPPFRLFLTLAIPGAISMIASSLWGLFDGIFVGQLLGETAFAALNLAFPFVVINFSLADLIGVGAAVPISISLGRKEEQKASNYFTCACLLIFATGLLMGALMYLSAPALMGWVGAKGELARLAVRYIRVYAVCSPFTTIIFAVDNFLRICGQIRGSMLLNILMSLLILGLEYLFLGVFQLDIGGSSLAVSLGMMVCALVALYPFMQGKLVLRFCKPHFHWAMLRQIIASGSPNFLSSIAARLTSIAMNSVLLFMGGEGAVTVYGILLYAGDILQQMLYGTCDSLQPAIGYNWGAGKVHRVKALAGCCLVVSAGMCIAGSLVMLFWPQAIAQLFLKESDPALLAQTGHAMAIYSLTYLTRWFGFAIQSFLIALDRPVPASILSVANAFALPVVLLAVLWPMGLEGIWLNGPITSALVCLLAAFLLARMKAKGNLVPPA